jgi:hypothetical protein
VNKNGVVSDLIDALIRKAGIPDEAEAGRIRIFEASNSRFFRELKRDYPVVSMNEYTNVYAERVPEEERQCDESNMISVFHFQNEASRVHGIPFRFLLVEVGVVLQSCVDQRRTWANLICSGRNLLRDEKAAGEADGTQGQDV